jgi:probable HAF family extracellular repeat protein
MASKIALRLATLSVLALPAIPGQAHAYQQKSVAYPYVLIDLGTFGGPNAYWDLPGQTTNARGAVIGDADTTTSDPHSPSCLNPDCFVSQGFQWQHGILTTLGSLPGGDTNAPFSINSSGLIAGFSQNGVVDPLTGFEESRAVLWKDGRLRNLGALPGGNESAAFVVNDQGMVAGPASNAMPDPYSCAFFVCFGTQTRAFVWQDGVMQDLGTLGGPDSLPLFMNNRGQIAGQSYTNTTANPATGQPTMDPFLWENGHMRDLGSLGGTLGSPNAMNSWGEVVGLSDLAGDQTFHPFVWDGRSLKDLGTLGGDYGMATWINDFGAVVGWTTTPGNSTVHAFLWKGGMLTDLGNAPGDTCSAAWGMNLLGQVVGDAGVCGSSEHGVLWERGTGADVNMLVAPSVLYVKATEIINDRGEIVGLGVLPNGNQHVVVLIPSRLAAIEGITSNVPEAGAAGPATAARASAACATAISGQAGPAGRRARLTRGHGLRCLGG